MAVEDVAEVYPEAHLADVEVTMVTMETAMAMVKAKGITNSKMVPNQHAGGATSMDTVKKTAANESKQTLHARASTVLHIGQNRKPHQSKKTKSKKKFKEQSVVKCICRRELQKSGISGNP